MRSTRPAARRVDEEGVHHRAGRVVRGDVERVEVEPLGLDLGTLGDLVAHRDEDVGEQLLDGRQRVPGADGAAAGRQRDVDGLGDQDPGVALVLQCDWRAASAASTCSRASSDALAGVGLGGRRQRADLAVGQGERRAVARHVEPDRLELVQVRRRRRWPPARRSRPRDRLGLQHADLDRVEWSSVRTLAGV